MCAPDPEMQDRAFSEGRRIALELTVNNHPGVMSHICGLFARRRYNVEGIVCLPIGGGEHSRIWLVVNEEQRLDQIVKQVQKLGDVLEVRRREADHLVLVPPEEPFQTNVFRSAVETMLL